MWTLMPPPLVAQEVPLAKQISTLNLTIDEVSGLETIAIAAFKAIQQAQAMVNGDRVQLTQQLLVPDVGVKDLEPTVRDSLNYEFKIRMAELDRQLKIRKLLGDDRWAALTTAVETLKANDKKKPLIPADLPGSGDATLLPRILNLLRTMGR
jgi:hypothetical protein